MGSVEKRLEAIVEGLSPEEKAKLVIEDLFRGEPVLSPLNRCKMLASMTPEEGRRYNSALDRYDRVKSNIGILDRLANSVRKQLLMRDRILWFERALVEVEEAIIFDREVAGPLLLDNSNLKPGLWSCGSLWAP